MIRVNEAKRLLQEQVRALNHLIVPLEFATDHILAEDVCASIDIPSFHQASMDGFAICFGTEPGLLNFRIIGEIQAGDTHKYSLRPGEAFRIFTGAAIPDYTDAIVMQEHALFQGNTIHVEVPIRRGAYIRLRGTQTISGETVLKAGSVLTPAAIGFLASLGYDKVNVIRNPRVTIIVTGNEIVQPGIGLEYGQVYESNSFSLRAALHQLHIAVNPVAIVRDVKSELIVAIHKAIKDADLVLISGGISVGKYDFAKEAVETAGVETIFYKIAQKPGKPLFAGKLGDKIVFALPGNPASVMVCFYEYVFPAIRLMSGYAPAGSEVRNEKLLKSVSNPEDRDCFIRAKRCSDGILPLEGQDSYMMQSFAQADSFIFLTGKKTLAQGENVEVHPIPVNLNSWSI